MIKNGDTVRIVQFVDRNLHGFRLCSREVLPNIVRTDGQFPMATVNQHRKLMLVGLPRSRTASMAARQLLPV